MKVTVERLPESQVLLDIAAEDDEFKQAVDRAFRRVSQQINVPGFRKGKAPRHIIERLYGRELFLEEAGRDLMDKLYRRALEQESLVPVGEPEVELVEAEPLAFKVTVPVYPTVDPGPYRDVRVEPVDASIEESAVEEVIERLRKSQSPWVDPAEPRTPREGDQVTIDLAVKEGEEEFDQPIEDAAFVLGESNLFDELRAALEQMQVGETRELEISFGADDENVSERVRGKTLAYTVTLKGIKERELLPLDDDFAKTVADADTVEALRREIRDDLHRARTNEARTEVVNRIVNAMAEGATIELPAAMVDDALEEEVNSLRMRLAQQRSSLETYLRLNNQTEEELRAELRPNTARRLRNSLLLREIAKREGIEVSDADVDAEVEELTAGNENADRLRELYGQDGYFRGMLRSDLFDRRLTDRLIEIATEGRGAVLNGWVAPEGDEIGKVGEIGEGGEADAALGPRPSALDEALTTGPMAGQTADTAAVSVERVAAEPDAIQAAAVGHTEENEAVAAQAPVDAVTPEERETQGPVGAGGVLADTDPV